VAITSESNGDQFKSVTVLECPVRTNSNWWGSSFVIFQINTFWFAVVTIQEDRSMWGFHMMSPMSHLESKGISRDGSSGFSKSMMNNPFRLCLRCKSKFDRSNERCQKYAARTTSLPVGDSDRLPMGIFT
jgi:hypothetical protein